MPVKPNMFISLLLILIFTLGGFGLTYLIAEDEPLLWRLSAGNVIGSAIFSLICFLLACFFGFSVITVSTALLISVAPLILLRNPARRAAFQRNWRKAKGKLEGASFKKFLRFAYYTFFFVLFCLFFERAIIENAGAIFTGASQNYGDLPFHLGAIYSFTDGGNFPPENPSYAFAKFSYPFMADLIAASFMKFGASVRDAMFVQNVSLAFSLLVILERFVFKLTASRLAGRIAPVLLFFSGGLGFLWFLKDYWYGAQSFFDFFSNLPVDYTISEKFRWGNSLVVLFITQRSILLGMPLTILVLQKLWEIFANAEYGVQNAEAETGAKQPINRKQEITKDITIPRSAFRVPHSAFRIFLVGLLAGTLPLIHVHSLVVLFVVSAFLFFYRLDRWRDWIAFGFGVVLVAVPELVWTMTGSATRLTEFVGWHFGWHKGEMNFFRFWLINTGIFIPFLLAGIYLVFNLNGQNSEDDKDKRKFVVTMSEERKTNLLLFSLPFFLCFFVANVVKLAPWEWDNIKVLIYWFIGSLPIVAFALAWLWNQDKILKTIAVACLVVLTASGALDVWRTASQAVEFKVFDRDAVAVANQIKQKTAPNALFLNAPTFNSAVVLSGRRSLMRFTGHLSSYGIDYAERENEVRRIYAGDATAEMFLNKHGIEYVLISPEEHSNLNAVNEEFFRRFPVIAEAGQYRVYQIKK
jgi:hypothetical protein